MYSFYIFVLNYANKIEIKTESKLLLVRNSYMYMYIMGECKYETCFECNLLILLSTKSTGKIEYLSREIDWGYHVMSEAIRT